MLSTTVDTLVVDKKEVYVVQSTDTLQTALDTMQKHNILSLPVMDPSQNICGMLGIMDILVYVAWAPYFETGAQPEGFTKLDSPISSVLGLTSESRHIYVIEPSLPVERLATPFSNGLHRVLIKVNEQNGLKILSQSDIVRFLYKHRSELTPIVSKKLSTLNCTKVVFSITDSESTLDGFKLMAIEKVPAVAVTNASTGEIIANLSASDLRGISSENISDVSLPVIDYLKKRKGANNVKALVVTMENTLLDVMQLIVENKIHRLWIVESKEHPKPVGVVTLTDIFKSFVTSAQ